MQGLGQDAIDVLPPSYSSPTLFDPTGDVPVFPTVSLPSVTPVAPDLGLPSAALSQAAQESIGAQNIVNLQPAGSPGTFSLAQTIPALTSSVANIIKTVTSGGSGSQATGPGATSSKSPFQIGGLSSTAEYAIFGGIGLVLAVALFGGRRRR
jgi:hypothetical protein